jgi:hypothetical protein
MPDWHIRPLLEPHWHGDKLQMSPNKAFNGHSTVLFFIKDNK